MSLYCKSHNCARKDTCLRYRYGKYVNFQSAPCRWYVNERGEEFGYKDPNDNDNCSSANNYKLYT
jgi:hypothetical protein